jgi:hypothetical protein
MASAHGAGLMVVPVFLGMSGTSAGMAHHHVGSATESGVALAASASSDAGSVAAGPQTAADNAASPGAALFATALHSLGYLLVTAFVALLVYEKLGLELLRKAWFNLDLLWAISLVVTGLICIAL